MREGLKEFVQNVSGIKSLTLLLIPFLLAQVSDPGRKVSPNVLSSATASANDCYQGTLTTFLPCRVC